MNYDLKYPMMIHSCTKIVKTKVKYNFKQMRQFVLDF